MLQNLKRCLARPSCALFAAPTARSRSYRTKHARLLFETLESRQMLSMGPLEISEFMAVNRTTWRDGEDEYEDWIEIHNPTADVVDLTGWHLTDEAENLSKWTFPVESIDPGEHLLVFASGSGRPDAAGNLHTNFKLDGDGEYLALIRPDGETISYAYSQEYPYEFPEQAADVSYGLSDGQEWYLPWATPGLPNASELVLIDEFMTINDTTLQDGDGFYSDWIELYNPTDAPIVLDGWYLTDDPEEDIEDWWQFPDGLETTLRPGGYLVVFASDSRENVPPPKDPNVDPAGNLHTNFKLSSVGEYVGPVQALLLAA
jgi:hypothetical protein